MRKILHSALTALFLFVTGAMYPVNAGTSPAPTYPSSKAPMIDQHGKKTLVVKMESEFRALEFKIRAAKIKSDEAMALEKAKVKDKITDFKIRRREAVNRLDTLVTTEKSEWRTTRKDLHEAVAKINNGRHKMASAFRLYAREEKRLFIGRVRYRLDAADRKVKDYERRAVEATNEQWNRFKVGVDERLDKLVSRVEG